MDVVRGRCAIHQMHGKNNRQAIFNKFSKPFRQSRPFLFIRWKKNCSWQLLDMIILVGKSLKQFFAASLLLLLQKCLFRAAETVSGQINHVCRKIYFQSFKSRFQFVVGIKLSEVINSNAKLNVVLTLPIIKFPFCEYSFNISKLLIF